MRSFTTTDAEGKHSCRGNDEDSIFVRFLKSNVMAELLGQEGNKETKKEIKQNYCVGDEVTEGFYKVSKAGVVYTPRHRVAMNKKN